MVRRQGARGAAQGCHVAHRPGQQAHHLRVPPCPAGPGQCPAARLLQVNIIACPQVNHDACCLCDLNSCLYCPGGPVQPHTSTGRSHQALCWHLFKSVPPCRHQTVKERLQRPHHGQPACATPRLGALQLPEAPSWQSQVRQPRPRTFVPALGHSVLHGRLCETSKAVLIHGFNQEQPIWQSGVLSMLAECQAFQAWREQEGFLLSVAWPDLNTSPRCLLALCGWPGRSCSGGICWNSRGILGLIFNRPP